MAIFKKLIAKSNLGYTQDMTVDVETSPDDTITFKFSTGFGATARLVETQEDWEGNTVCVYSYEVEEKLYGVLTKAFHHLHMRILQNGRVYFQTVQTPSNPGGSTFNSWDIAK